VGRLNQKLVENEKGKVTKTIRGGGEKGHRMVLPGPRRGNAVNGKEPAGPKQGLKPTTHHFPAICRGGGGGIGKTVPNWKWRGGEREKRKRGGVKKAKGGNGTKIHHGKLIHEPTGRWGGGTKRNSAQRGDKGTENYHGEGREKHNRIQMVVNEVSQQTKETLFIIP